MINNDIKIIQNDILFGVSTRFFSFVKYQPILLERGIRSAGFETYRSFELPWGRKDWHLAIWIADGRLQLRHDAGELDAASGDLLIVPARHSRAAVMASESLSYFYMHAPQTPQWRALEAEGVHKRVSRNVPKMTALLPLLEEAVVGNGDHLHRVGIHLVRAFCECAVDDVIEGRDSVASERRIRLASVWKRVYARPDVAWTADDLARAACFSKGHFHRVCRESHGIGPMAMVTRIRLELGAGLLLHSEATIDDIAERVGFSCARAFSQAFLREYHIRPGNYRRQGGSTG